MKVTFQVNLEDWKAFLRAVKRSPNFMVWVMLAVFLVQTGVSFYADRRLRLRIAYLGWKAILPHLWAFLLPLVILAAFFGIFIWAQKAQLKKLPLLNEPVTIATDEEGISGTISKGRDNIFWVSLHKILETDAHFFVLSAPQAGLIIPKRAFDSPAQCAEFGALLKRKWAEHHGDVAPIAAAQ